MSYSTQCYVQTPNEDLTGADILAINVLLQQVSLFGRTASRPY